MTETTQDGGPVNSGIPMPKYANGQRPSDNKMAVQNYAERPECFKSTLQEVLFVLTATMAIGTSSFTVGTTGVMTSFIAKDLNMTTAELTWINGANSLAAGSFLLLFARLADLFGKRSMFITSMFLFAVVSLGCGFARTPLTLDVLMGLTGLLSAAAVPPAQGMLGVIYAKPSKRKNAVFACFSAGNPLGFVAGMISSGVAAGIFGWRASFWFLAIVYATFTVIAIFTVPNDTTPKERFTKQTWKKLDVVGNVLALAGIGLFSGALSLGSDAPDGWRTPYVLVLMILGLVCIVAFPFWEHYGASHPLVPLYIFKDRNFSLLLAILLPGFTGFSVAGFWVSLYFQRIWHASALHTAVYLLPMAIVGTLINVIAGAILHRVSNKLLMTVGAGAYAASFLCFALNKSSFSYWALFFPGLCLCVVGADFEFNVTNMYVVSSLPSSHQSIASGLFQTVTKLCVTLGFGISTALFDHTLQHPAAHGYHAHDPIEPYAATFWFSTAIAAAALVMCPFVTVGTQGHSEPSADEEKAVQTSALACALPQEPPLAVEKGQESSTAVSVSESAREKPIDA